MLCSMSKASEQVASSACQHFASELNKATLGQTPVIAHVPVIAQTWVIA